MQPSALDPIALAHSWPLHEEAGRFELGHVLGSVVTELIEPARIGDLGLHHVGCWECNLADDSLTWSGGVYDLFGLPRGIKVSREDAVSLYREESRAAMERLRGYAIQYRRGFTLDVTIRPAIGGQRSMRLIAAPIFGQGSGGPAPWLEVLRQGSLRASGFSAAVRNSVHSGTIGTTALTIIP